MKRRDFLGIPAGTAVALTGLGGCEGELSETFQQTPSVLDGNGRLAGKTLDELRKQYQYDLFDEYIPFHDKWVVDHEYGGFMLHTGWNGPTLSTDKSAWTTGRGIWTYSFLYNKIDHDPKHLTAAKKAVEFIMKHKPDGGDLWLGSYSRDGKVLGGPNTRTYGDIFVANGLSEYSKASGEDKYWDLAKYTMLKCLRIYDLPGYFPDAAQMYLGQDAPLMSSGARVQGNWFVFLRMATQMLEFKSDPEIEAVAARCVDAIMNHHYNPEFDLNNEVLNHDFSRPDNEIAQLVYTGHSIETFWMVLYEAVRIKNKALFDLAADRLKRHLEVAWDDVYGGLFRNLRHVDNNVWDVDKAGWVQMEALIGLMCVIEHTGAQWAKDFFSKHYTWVIERFPLKQYGYSLWLDYTDRWVTFDKGDGSRRAEHFHHPRHLMLNLLAVERMIKRNGKVSTIFA